jgi:organic hydroperoxide reductase OsmC/OhrA
MDSTHGATVTWKRGDEKFTDQRYSRAHRWSFDGGLTVPASASPHLVRAPFSDPHGVDPEEAFVAALSSCHMLWFLSIAAERGFVVDSYEDHAVGRMEPDDRGRLCITRVVLAPRIEFGGESRPEPSDVQAMHEAAHHSCFIANSVRTEVVVA